ncbi:MAG: hypothetical protein PHE27_00975, partial [Alphaproteobacteria bacterium]|nr:hypothetical protein [Alphaproteobacteria bacterium]
NTINAAFTKGGTVYLKAGTYTIDGTIILMSNVTLAGARGAKIKLANNANWPSNKPLILGSNVSNVKISGFEIDGNKANNGSSNGRTLKSGDDYYNLIGLISSSAVEISNMYMHDGFANAVFSKRTKNLNVHDNVIKNMNVEGVNAYRGGTTYVTNNCMRVIHGGARSDSTTPMYVASNDIAAVSTASNLGGIIVENEAGISMYVYNCSNNIHNVKATIGYMTGGTSSMVKTSGCPSVPTMSAATKSCSVSDLSSFTVTATGSTDTTSADSMSTSSLFSTSGTSSSGTSSSSSSSSSSASTATSTASTATATAPTVTSSGSTTTLTAGNSTNQQVQINAALAKGGIVYLKAGVYTINGQITIGVDNTTLKGERGAVIKLVDKANWDPYVELVHVKAKNVRITGFEIDGNAPNNTTSNGDTCNCGREYYDIIFVDNTSNVEIDHMYLHDNWNDSILVKGSKNVNVHNNIFRRPGHDVVANYSRSSTVYITNNCIRTYCNSAIRAYSSGPVYAINNDISRETGYTGGYAAFEIQADNPQLYNCDNNVHNMKLVTVFLYGADSSNYHVGGCPISPAKALIVDSCSVSDIDKD